MHGQREHVAGPSPGEGTARGVDLAVRDGQRGVRESQAPQLRADNARNFSGRAAAQVLFVFFDDDKVRLKLSRRPGQFLDVGVLTVAGMTQQ